MTSTAPPLQLHRLDYLWGRQRFTDSELRAATIVKEGGESTSPKGNTTSHSSRPLKSARGRKGKKKRDRLARLAKASKKPRRRQHGGREFDEEAEWAQILTFTSFQDDTNNEVTQITRPSLSYLIIPSQYRPSLTSLFSIIISGD